MRLGYPKAWSGVVVFRGSGVFEHSRVSLFWFQLVQLYGIANNIVQTCGLQIGPPDLYYTDRPQHLITAGYDLDDIL